MKSVKWFMNEVNKRLQRYPVQAIRLDVHEGDEKASREAWLQLTKKYRPISCRYSQHANPALRRQGLMRVAFFGPEYPWPKPIKVIKHDWPEAKTENAALKRGMAVRAQLEKLQRQYGPDYHIEWKFSHFLFRVWRGEDWLTVNTSPFYPAEVALLLNENISVSRWLEPDAAYAKQKKDEIKRHNKAIAKSGGEATAEYTDKEIIEAFKRHKSASRVQGITHAVNEITDHLGYANPGTLWKRLERIASPKRPSDWYKAL
jgi:hypothetical protein